MRKKTDYGYIKNGWHRRTSDKHKMKYGKIIAVLLCVVAIFAGSVALGNFLKDRAAVLAAQTDPIPDVTQSLPASPVPDVKTVHAAYFDLSLAKDANSVKAELERLSSASYTDISLPLRASDGNLLYSSEVDRSLSKGENSSLLGASELVSLIKSYNVNICGCFDIYSASMSDDTRAVAYEYELAVLRELSSAGIGEITLFGLPFEKDRIDETTAMLGSIKTEIPALSIGVAVPVADICGEDAAVVLKKLSLYADFICADFSAFRLQTTDTYDRTDAAVKESSLYFSKYALRPLLSPRDSSQLSAFTDALTVNGIYSWQIIAPFEPAQTETAGSETGAVDTST